MGSSEIKIFHNDDPGYDQWVAQHGGYVLTAPRRAEYMLCEPKCPHLGRDQVAWRLTRKPRRQATPGMDVNASGSALMVGLKRTTAGSQKANTYFRRANTRRYGRSGRAIARRPGQIRKIVLRVSGALSSAAEY